MFTRKFISSSNIKLHQISQTTNEPRNYGKKSISKFKNYTSDGELQLLTEVT